MRESVCHWHLWAVDLDSILHVSAPPIRGPHSYHDLADLDVLYGRELLELAVASAAPMTTTPAFSRRPSPGNRRVARTSGYVILAEPHLRTRTGRRR
eukprot:scaffold1582_cov363-Prasinococcus_capsulatus_cf.AAC.6